MATETPSLFDVSLDHWPTIRIPAQDEADAIAEYKRLYGIESSHNQFVAVKAAPGSPAPVEPPTWIEFRKNYGALGSERASTPTPIASTPSADVSASASKPTK